MTFITVRRASNPRPDRRARRLRLEPLEDRLALSHLATVGASEIHTFLARHASPAVERAMLHGHLHPSARHAGHAKSPSARGAGRITAAAATSTIGTTTTFGYTSNDAHALAIQPDGRVVVAGTVNITRTGWTDASTLYTRETTRFGVARYNADLTPDTSFGSGGTKTTALVAGLSNDANAMTIDATSTANNGKIVLVGATPSRYKGAYYWDFSVARYTASGTLDTSFGGGKGYVTANLAGNSRSPSDAATSVAIDGTQGGNYDKIVVAGYVNNGSYTVPTLARFTPTGALDTSFNSSGPIPGSVRLDLGTNAYVTSLAIDSQGDYVIGGSLENWYNQIGLDDSNGGGYFLARFTPNGALDPTFGNGGKIVVTGSFNLNGLALDASGNIDIVGGGYDANSVSIAWAERFTSLGVLDPAFGSGGTVWFPQAAGSLFKANALAIQPGTGSLIVVGPSWSTDPGFAIARLNPDGTLDTTFNGTGTLVYSFPSDGNGGSATGVAVTAAGTIVVAGSTETGVGQHAWDVLTVQP